MRTGIVMQQQHPFNEEAWSLPANGGTKFRQNRAVRGRRNGVATLLEFGDVLQRFRRGDLHRPTGLMFVFDTCPPFQELLHPIMDCLT